MLPRRSLLFPHTNIELLFPHTNIKNAVRAGYVLLVLIVFGWLAMCPCPADHVPRLCAQDIGSGNCAVHNTWMLDHPQKSVLWGPWRYYPYAAPLPPPCVLHELQGPAWACLLPVPLPVPTRLPKSQHEPWHHGAYIYAAVKCCDCAGS